jgi:hypothetical protein
VLLRKYEDAKAELTQYLEEHEPTMGDQLDEGAAEAAGVN